MAQNRGMTSVPKWRVILAGAILVVLVALATQLAPIYLHNMRLQQFVEDTARSQASLKVSDDLLRVLVLNKAAQLGLPVHASNVHVERSPDAVRIAVRYIVRVDLPFYTVDLHFYPGAGSQ